LCSRVPLVEGTSAVAVPHISKPTLNWPAFVSSRTTGVSLQQETGGESCDVLGGA
jgi:hypothetical protein